MAKNLTVVIPAYNEEKTIGKVLKDILDYSKDLEIIVVDDGSDDDTGIIVGDCGVKAIRHPQNLGYGAAIKSGIRAASNENILIMDSDGQHANLSDIGLLYSFIKDYDMVVGARPKGHDVSMFRVAGKFLLTKIASYLAEKDIPDLNSGFRIFRKSIVEGYYHILSNEFSFTTTLTLVMLREGYRVKYVPIKVQPRTTKSTVRIFRHGLGTLIFILRIITLFNPLRIFLPISLILFILGVLRLFQGIVTGIDHAVTAVVGIVSSIVIFMFGLLADQVASLRRERLIRNHA